MSRSILVVIHAAGGVAGVLVGLPSFTPPRTGDNRSWVRAVYVACIGILLASLIALVVLDWDGLDTSARIAFTALGGLAGVMMLRIVLAVRVASVREAGWEAKYINHVYFTYISLWEGFVILPALNLPMPQITVPVIAIAVLLLGHMLLVRYKRRVLTER